MSKTTVSGENIYKPAPRWYRVLKRVIYLLTASSITSGTLKRINISDADIILIMGWMIMSMEIMGLILANGETYLKEEEEITIK